MGVFKRYRDAQAAQKDAENAMPGAYQSNYTAVSYTHLTLPTTPYV